jgi:predicted esterase
MYTKARGETPRAFSLCGGIHFRDARAAHIGLRYPLRSLEVVPMVRTVVEYCETRMLARIAVSRCLIGAMALLVLPGCWSYHEARGPRPAGDRSTTLARTMALSGAVDDLPRPLEPSDWPARDVGVAQALFDQTPELILDFMVAPGFDEGQLTEADRQYLGKWDRRVAHKGIYGTGLLRVIEPRDPVEKPSALSQLFADMFTGFSPNAYFITSLDISNPGLTERVRERVEETAASQQDSSEKIRNPEHSGGLRSAETDTKILLEEGTALRLPPVRTPDQPPFRGVLVRMTALAGNEYERKVVEEFERRDWAVVHIETRTSARPYSTPAMNARAREVEAEIADIRRQLREKYDTSADMSGESISRNWEVSRNDPLTLRQAALLVEVSRLRSGQFEWPADGSGAELARTIATAFDNTLAENAYAAEAALRYLASHRPDVPLRPLVVVGFSAGAIATPAVVARLDARKEGPVDAAVLIGGGANALDIALRSELVKRSVPVVWDGKEMPREALLVLRDSYLEASRLDPYHTAQLLRGRPVLQAHGRADTWVPASSGELLYERLGRPDQLVMSGGHELLFYFLPDKAEFIADWVDEATGTGSK